MEQTIGEIFEYNGEWYQCVQGNCEVCDFNRKEYTCLFGVSNCVKYRKSNDGKAVTFRKLEKVGEPKMRDGKITQKLVKAEADGCRGCCFWTGTACLRKYDDCRDKEIYVEIKQNKEDMGEIEFGKCDVCGKEAPLERTYFYYPVHCECCGSKDKDGQKQHFELVHHCKDCPAPMPKEIHPLLKSEYGDEIRANITNILPSKIEGKFIVNDKIIENMGENKAPLPKEDNALTRTVYAYINGKISDKEFVKVIREMSDEYPYDKNNLKPFSLELAKQGKPVCTRDGRKARIVCFDLKGAEYPIVVAVKPHNHDIESIMACDEEGKYSHGEDSKNDLMMAPEKKEGWVNVYKNLTTHNIYTSADVFESKEIAEEQGTSRNRIATCKIEWEEE